MGLPVDEVEKLICQEEKPKVEITSRPAPEKQELDVEQPKRESEQMSNLQRNELRLLFIVSSSGYTKKAVLASELGVTERQVTRYFVRLVSMGLLIREVNSYRLTEEGRNRANLAGPPR